MTHPSGMLAKNVYSNWEYYIIIVILGTDIVCVSHFSHFLVFNLQIFNSISVSIHHNRSLRYSFALLSSLKNSDASSVVSPVVVKLFLSG